MTYSFQDLQRLDELEQQRRDEVTTESSTLPSPQPDAPAGAQEDSGYGSSRSRIREATKNAKPAPKERGLVSKTGDFLKYLVNPDGLKADAENFGAAAINQATPEWSPTKALTQWLDDNTFSSQEREQVYQQAFDVLAEREKAGSLSPSESAAYSIMAGYKGGEQGTIAGLMAPISITAKVTDQENKWGKRPEYLKDSALAESAFNIMEIVTPTVIAGVATRGAAVSGPQALILESALETGLQGDQDELIASRTVATEAGVIADYFGFDGEQLTRDLLEDRKPNAKALNAVIGFFQNLGINYGANQIIKAGGSAFRRANGIKSDVTEEASQVAEVLGKSPKTVQKQLDDVELPVYRADAEPTDVIDVNTGVNKPTKNYVSEPALVAEAKRTSGIGDDDLLAADRKYFSNWKPISDEVGIRRVIQEATSTLRKLKDFPEDFNNSLIRAEDWWTSNRQLLDTNIDLAAERFYKDQTRLTQRGRSSLQISETVNSGKSAQEQIPTETLLREFTEVSEEGFLAAALIGEELGVKIQKMARQAINLENSEIDFTNVIENILDLHDKVNLFMIPYRRGKRRWAKEGMAQQRRSIRKVRDADVQASIRKREPVSDSAPSFEFDKVNFNDVDPGVSLRRLWNEYKDGNEQAGKYLKTYLSTVAYVDPRSVVGAVENLSTVVQKQLDKANLSAAQSLYYQGLLTRIRPQTASAGSNIARLVLEPLGSIASGEFHYGLGQIVGGWNAMGDSLKVFNETFTTGRALNSGSKIDTLEEVKAAYLNEENLYKQVKQQLNEANANSGDRFAAWLNHQTRLLAFHPWSNVATRGLTAGDEAGKVIYGAQVATGRAYQFASQTGTWKDVKRQIEVQMNNVFRNGDTMNKIIDGDVLDEAKRLFFQSDIPVDGNAIDKLFKATENAVADSGIFRIFNPFPRLYYNIMEQSGRFLFQEALLGVPMGNGKYLGGFQRYRDIYNGSEGALAEMTLKSQFALSKVLMGSAVTMAAFGGMTGANSGNMPKQSFIIPFNNKEGYIAISYAGIEPYATILTLTADLTNAIKEDVITEGEYEKLLGALVYSLGVSATDKTFQQGLVNMGELLSVRNYSSGNSKELSALAQSVSMPAFTRVSGAPGAIFRSIMDRMQPYQVNTFNPDNPAETIWNEIRRRLTGGAGLVARVDEFTGKPIPKVATLDDGDSYWAAVIGGWIQEGGLPGNTSSRKENKDLFKELNFLEFKISKQDRTRYKGVALNPQEQADFARLQYKIGLPEALKEVINGSEYKNLKTAYQDLRKKQPLGYTGEGSALAEVKDRMRSLVRQRYDLVRKLAADRLLDTNQDFNQRFGKQRFGLQSNAGLSPEITEVLAIANPQYG